jgi:hypothetical protein
VPTEDQLQIFANDLLETRHVSRAYWHHSPNGGWRDPATAKKMKRFGTKAGFSDFILLPCTNPTSTFCETDSF